MACIISTPFAKAILINIGKAGLLCAWASFFAACSPGPTLGDVIDGVFAFCTNLSLSLSNPQAADRFLQSVYVLSQSYYKRVQSQPDPRPI